MFRNHTGPNLRQYPHAESTELIILALSIFRARKQRKEQANAVRLRDHKAPRMWVHAHINSRSDYSTGYLGELAHTDHRNTREMFTSYVDETRKMYRTGRAA